MHHVDAGTRKSESVHVLFLNPAPVLRDAPEGEQDRPDRETTPWYVCIPVLGVALMAMGPDGPVTGYWSESDAKLWALSLYMGLKNNPARLSEIQNQPVWPGVMQDGYKLMTRVINIPAI